MLKEIKNKIIRIQELRRSNAATPIPNKNAISIVEDTKYTFCENCEENIYSHYIEDYDIMSYWSSWKVGK